MKIDVFDPVADSYDRTFTDRPLGLELRQLVWSRLEESFKPGDRILELNCGTGADAIRLASRGVQVVATDSSSAMLARAKSKARAKRLSGSIDFSQLDLTAQDSSWPDCEFDGAFSNFGGLNCVPDLRAVAIALARRVKPGGRVIVILMGRSCAWEILWHFFHLKPGIALRRFARAGAEARVGQGTIRVWYPSCAELRRAFAPEFLPKRIQGLGVFLPPSYLWDVMESHPKVYRTLRKLEAGLGSAPLVRGLGDHILTDFERRIYTARAKE